MALKGLNERKPFGDYRYAPDAVGAINCATQITGGDGETSAPGLAAACLPNCDILPMVSIHGVILPHVPCDLGIIVTSDLTTPILHVNSIVAEVHRRINAVHRCFVSRNVERLVRACLVG